MQSNVESGSDEVNLNRQKRRNIEHRSKDAIRAANVRLDEPGIEPISDMNPTFRVCQRALERGVKLSGAHCKSGLTC